MLDDSAPNLDLRYGSSLLPLRDRSLNLLQQSDLRRVIADEFLLLSDQLCERNFRVDIRFQELLLARDDETTLARLHIHDQPGQVTRIGDDRCIVLDDESELLTQITHLKENDRREHETEAQNAPEAKSYLPADRHGVPRSPSSDAGPRSGDQSGDTAANRFQGDR